jgi:hypothetical protein
VLLRAHWLFAALLAAGAALRAVTYLAYRPALFYADSFWYLHNAEEFVPQERKPIGYAAFLELLPGGVRLELAPLVQHGLGLGIAVLLYVLLTRLGVWRWAAALATAPILLDAFQLSIEQHILSETPFEAFLVGACALLVWRAPLTPLPAAVAGALIAGAALMRPIALVAIVPAVLAVALARARPSRPAVMAVLVAGFAVPLGVYGLWYEHHNGSFAITGSSARFTYARVAPFADCSAYRVPAAERPLCPDRERFATWPPHRFAWDPASPWNRLRGEARERLAGSFTRRVLRHQPLDYAGAVAEDLLHGYAWKRSTPGRVRSFEETFLFQRAFPREEPARKWIRRDGGTGGRVRPRLTAFLRGYQSVAYTPGPLLAIGVLAGLAAALGLRRLKGSPLRTAAFLFAAVGLSLALFPAATHHLSPRYQLPAIALLPPAIALAARAFREPRPQPPAPAPAPTAAPPVAEPV